MVIEEVNRDRHSIDSQWFSHQHQFQHIYMLTIISPGKSVFTCWGDILLHPQYYQYLGATLIYQNVKH